MTQADKEREEFDNIFGFTDNLWKSWITPDDNFRVPTHHAPITNQLERVWLINNAEPPNNLVTNTGAGGTTYKVTDTPKISLEEYENLYFKLFMKDNKSPFRAYENVENKLSKEELTKTASVLDKVSSEAHLLGGYYVVLSPFKTCPEAHTFFKEHCKTALFIQRESKCEGCSYRQGNVCSMMSKHLASTIKYDDKLVNGSIKKAYAESRITKESAIKLLRVKDSKKRMQNYLQHIASKEKVNDGAVETPLPMYHQDNIMRQDNLVKDDIKVASVAIEKLIANGSSRDNIISKVGKFIGTSTVNQLIPEVLRKIKGPINTYKFAECDDSLRGQVHLLKKDAACGDCVFNDNRSCSKYKVSFIQESKDPVILSLGEKIKEARTKNKDYMESFFVKCVDSGINYGQIKQAFEINIGKEELSNLLSGSLKKAKKLDPFNFSKCEGSFYSSVDKVYMGKNCHGCIHNAGVNCSKLKKAFVNPVQVKSMYATDIPVVRQEVAPDKTMSKYASIANNEYISGGNLATVSRKLASMGLNTSQISAALVDFVSNAPSVNSVQLNGCKETELLKYASKLDKTETCKMCTMNKGIKCAKFEKEFLSSESSSSFGTADDVKINNDPLYQTNDFNISF